MPAATETQLTGLFDQAVQNFGEALKAGVKAQEQIANWWTDALNKAVPATEFQKRSRTLASEVIPTAQKNAEEIVKLIEQNYKRSVDLLRKAFDSTGAANAGDLQAKAQGLWEASVELVKDNAQAMAQTNIKVLELWADVLRQTSPAKAAPKA